MAKFRLTAILALKKVNKILFNVVQHTQWQKSLPMNRSEVKQNSAAHKVLAIKLLTSKATNYRRYRTQF